MGEWTKERLYQSEYIQIWPDDPKPPCTCETLHYIDYGRIQVHSNNCLLRQWIKGTHNDRS